MPDNRISAGLSQADQQAVLAAVDTIREKLPFLIDLTPEERRALPKMGDRSRGFVTQALTVAAQNPDVLPRSFDLEEMRKDVDLVNSLQPVLAALSQLSELVEDTYTAAGSEAYTSALPVYQYARGAAGQTLLPKPAHGNSPSAQRTSESRASAFGKSAHAEAWRQKNGARGLASEPFFSESGAPNSNFELFSR